MHLCPQPRLPAKSANKIISNRTTQPGDSLISKSSLIIKLVNLASPSSAALRSSLMALFSHRNNGIALWTTKTRSRSLKFYYFLLFSFFLLGRISSTPLSAFFLAGEPTKILKLPKMKALSFPHLHSLPSTCANISLKTLNYYTYSSTPISSSFTPQRTFVCGRYTLAHYYNIVSVV